MDLFSLKQKNTAKKQTAGPEKSARKSKCKKKKSSKKRIDKENGKCSISPDVDASDHESDEATKREEEKQPKARKKKVPETQTTAQSLLSSSQRLSNKHIQPPPSMLQLQPQAKGYGENVKIASAPSKIVPGKVVPAANSSSNVAMKPKSINENQNNVQARTSKSDLKPSFSQSTLSSKGSKSSLASNMSRSRAFIPSEVNNESLRWENACSDSEDEEERLKLYKLNRRKRYLAAANKKYSDWLKTLNGNMAGSGNSSRQEKNNSMKSSSYAMMSQKEDLVSGLGPSVTLANPNSQVMVNS